MTNRVGQLLAKFFRSIAWSLTLLLAMYTAGVYWLQLSLFSSHWVAGLLMLSIPIAWLLNAGALLFWLLLRRWQAVLPALMLAVGWFLLGSRTFALAPAREADSSALRLLSYNVRGFDVMAGNPNDRNRLTKQLLAFVQHDPAAVKCFQEFIDVPVKGGSATVSVWLQQNGYPHTVWLHPEEVGQKNGLVGMSLFSKYPIIRSERHHFDRVNGILWADIVRNTDTLRIINVHLHSMGIRVQKVLRQTAVDGVKQETHGIFSALRQGFISRAEQLKLVEQTIRKSPYPVLVTGDFNDTPYSVVYEQLRRVIPNSFEEAGSGFGFTYNRMPRFIRIDHQFHDPRWRCVQFETLSDQPYSDHYPIAGTYSPVR